MCIGHVSCTTPTGSTHHRDPITLLCRRLTPCLRSIPASNSCLINRVCVWGSAHQQIIMHHQCVDVNQGRPLRLVRLDWVGFFFWLETENLRASPGRQKRRRPRPMIFFFLSPSGSVQLGRVGTTPARSISLWRLSSAGPCESRRHSNFAELRGPWPTGPFSFVPAAGSVCLFHWLGRDKRAVKMGAYCTWHQEKKKDGRYVGRIVLSWKRAFFFVASLSYYRFVMTRVLALHPWWIIFFFSRGK